MSAFPFFIFWTSLVIVTARNNFVLDERWVCNVKKTCLDCLKLAHCSWCTTDNKCFYQKLPIYKDFCSNNTVNHEDYGLSLEENAECSCADGKKELRCYPPGVSEGLECSGRGVCTCGHCVCNPTPEPENPTKTIMGKYCEFDNFSCTGPKCNEGPYSRSEPGMPDDANDDNKRSDDIDDSI